MEKWRKDRERAIKKFLAFNAQLTLEYNMKILGGVYQMYLDGLKFQIGDVEAVYTTDEDKEQAKKTLEELKKQENDGLIYVSDFKVEKKSEPIEKSAGGLGATLTQ